MADKNTTPDALLIDTLKQSAQLAKLTFSDSQYDQLSQDFDHILSMIASLKQLDTQNIAPMAHPLELHQPLRSDVVTEKNQSELFLNLTQPHDQGHFLVPTVIEQGIVST
jgi:aspartyl-tRNA(Asn)/glutamyl-tRNA(Gln) amidotransferase subunit C